MNITVQGVQVYLNDRGSGTPVLFLHGVPDSAEMWNGVIDRLEGSYRCIAIDLPGLGRSQAPANFLLSLENMARFIDELVVSYHIPTPLNLVVTDFGVPYGLSWAVTHPEKVQHIAITGGANFFSDYPWHPNARILRTPLLGEFAMALSASPKTFVKTMLPNGTHLTADHWLTVHKLSMAQPSVRRMVLRLYRSLDAENFRGWEDRLLTLIADVPTCVLWGDKDPFITPQRAERFRGAQIEHFPDNGHWLAIEAPEAVARRLDTFLHAPTKRSKSGSLR